MSDAFHGTPITPESVLEALVDPETHMTPFRFCVSFYRPDQIELLVMIALQLILDNGAFSAHRKGLVLDSAYWARFYAFVERWLGFIVWFIIPDVIDAGSQEQDALLRDCPPSLKPWGVPVWHMDEPISRLVWLCETWPRVAIGSTGEFWIIGSAAWRERMDEVFDTLLPDGGQPTTPLHMLRGLQCQLPSYPYPFDTVDSTDRARNHNRLNRFGTMKPWAVKQTFQRWDRLNCPKLWVPSRYRQQPDLLGDAA
jgi:hypothetical protein